MESETEVMLRELQTSRALAKAVAGREPGRTCMNCGETKLKAEGSFADASSNSDRPEDHIYWILRCAECGLAQLDRQIPEGELSGLEDENPEYQGDAEDEAEELVRAHSFIVDLVERFSPVGRMLEIGCSHGYKLEAARRAGWKVEGIELSPRSCLYACERFGLPVHQGTLATFVPSQPFDAIVAWHVLEHAPQLDVFLAFIHSMLRRGGHLFVQVPSYTRYRAHYPWSDHPECFNRVHYWYFGEEDLSSALAARGFEPVFALDDPRLFHLTLVARRA